jgi:signal transduction histidine kinase
MRVEVEDTGTGIPASEQVHLFGRFFRTQAAEENAIQGSGLGLGISQAIAQAHGGLIEVTSHENAGTTFRAVFSKRGGCKNSGK